MLIILIRYLIRFIGLITNPLIGSIILIFISLIIRLLIAELARKWMSYLIVLLFLGGIIILFIYISALISNLKIFLKNYFGHLFFSLIIFIIISRIFYFQYWDINFEIKYSSISIIYIKSNFVLISICIIYLLMVLIICVKLSQKFKGRLKAKINDF